MVRAPCNFDWIYPTSSAKGVKSKWGEGNDAPFV